MGFLDCFVQLQVFACLDLYLFRFIPLYLYLCHLSQCCVIMSCVVFSPDGYMCVVFSGMSVCIAQVCLYRLYGIVSAALMVGVCLFLVHMTRHSVH